MEESRPPVPWRALDVVAFVGVFIAAAAVVPLVVLFLAGAFKPGVVEPPPLALIAAQALINTVIVGFIFLAIRLHRRTIREGLRWTPTEIPVGWLISAGGFLALTVLVASAFFPEPKDSPFEKLLTTPASIAAFTVLGIVIAPITEEIMFRGFLYSVLADVINPTVALIATALAFAGLHFVQLWGNWAAMGLIVVVGFILTGVRQKTNSLIPSVIMHTAYNGLIFGVAALAWVFQHK